MCRDNGRARMKKWRRSIGVEEGDREIGKEDGQRGGVVVHNRGEGRTKEGMGR